MSTVHNNEKVLEKNNKLLPVDCLKIGIFSFAYYTAFVMNNLILFIFIGLFILSLYIKKIIKSQAYILSLYLLCDQPIGLTFGQTNIPFLGRFIVLLLYFITFWCSMKKRNYFIFKQDAGWLIFILGFIFLLIFEWFRIGANKNGLELIFNSFFLGFIPAVAVLVSLNKIDDFKTCIKFSQIIFISHLMTFFLLYLTSDNYIDRMFEVNNPIGFSFYIISNTVIGCYFFRKNNPMVVIFVVFVSLFLTISVMQRSLLLSVVALVLYALFVSNISIIKKIAVIIFITSASICAFRFMPREVLYKMNIVFVFMENWKEYINFSVLGGTMSRELGTFGTRIELWQTVINNTDIYFGNGVGSFVDVTGYSYPHNIFLEAYWIFGFFGFLGISLCVIIFLYKNFRKNIIYSEIGYINGIIIVLLTVSLFSLSITYSFTNIILYNAIIFKYKLVASKRGCKIL
jgi:hypothetical protein